MLQRSLLALIAGCLLSLSFSPFDIYSLGFIVPAILLFLWMRSTPQQAFFIGLLFGIGFFGVGTTWIYISIHRFGNASVLLSLLITFLFVFALALYPAILGFIFRQFFRKKSRYNQCLLIFPALWVIWEWLRTHLLTGFPWLLLGYSQTTTPLRGFAPIIGIYGISLCVTLISGALVLLVDNKKNSTNILLVALIVGLVSVGYIFEKKIWTHKTKEPLTITIIQGNIPQSIKWNASYLLRNMAIYRKLTLEHLSSHLIVWPEGAVPVAIQEVSDFIKSLDVLAKKNHVSIAFGAPFQNLNTLQFYNAIVMIGEYQGEYLKRHLVPFGEYTPIPDVFERMMKYFDIPMSDFLKGDDNQSLLQVNHIPIASFICYEIAFPEVVLNSASQSQLLLTISDDSWFGQSIALPQHFQMAQMRSLETQRPMLLATNTGITAFISPFGKIIQGAPIGERTVLTQTITPMSGRTPLMIWHYYPIWIICSMMLLMGIIF